MKKQINQLKQLAKQCESFAHEFEFPDGFSEIKNGKSRLTIYCADRRKTMSVYFSGTEKNSIELALYSDKITIPVSMTTSEIQKMVEKMTKLIEYQFGKERDSLRIQQEQLKQRRIKELEDELEQLKTGSHAN